MLSQSEVAKLLEHCASEDLPELAMEEVLSAYIAWLATVFDGSPTPVSEDQIRP